MKLLGSSLATGLARVRLSLQLARLDERNALAERAANDGLWDFDVENNDVYFSPRWRAMLGYDEADLKGGFDWRSLVHPDDISRVQAAIREHVAGKTPIFESVHRMRHRNGEWRWVISRARRSSMSTAGCCAWSASSSTSPSASCTRRRCSARRRAPRSRCSRSATA